MTEREYRALRIDSYSSLKEFIEDRKTYYKKFILGEKVDEDRDDALVFGILVDTLQFEPHEYENRYSSISIKTPAPQYKKLVEKLYKITQTSTVEGVVTRTLVDMLEEAYESLRFDARGNKNLFKREKFDTVLEKFVGTEVEIYYRQMREAEGKVLIDQETKSKADAIIAELKNNPISKDIVNAVTTEHQEVFTQFPIIGEVSASLVGGEAHPAKCLVDKLIIKHDTKEIFIYDLKTCWDNEGQFMFQYNKYRYYIQQALYFYLVSEWAKKDQKLKDYVVHPMKYLVAESNNYKQPLIYETSIDTVIQGMRGYKIGNKTYPGVISTIKEIMWHTENGIWNISKENHEKKGIIKILPYETKEEK